MVFFTVKEPPDFYFLRTQALTLSKDLLIFSCNKECFYSYWLVCLVTYKTTLYQGVYKNVTKYMYLFNFTAICSMNDSFYWQELNNFFGWIAFDEASSTLLSTNANKGNETYLFTCSQIDAVKVPSRKAFTDIVVHEFHRFDELNDSVTISQ